MLTLDSVSKYHGSSPILVDASLLVAPASRIGVVGPNGVGKSTLLRILAGIEEPDSGSVTRTPPDLSVRYLAQERDPEAPLSGGEAARAALAEIMRAQFDVLLLDEPTNDLDFDGLDRLERFVSRTDAAVVVVSHDRVFLDRTVDRIVEIEERDHRIRVYAGGFSEYERERGRTRARQYERWEQSLEERRRIEEQARRMREWEERGYGQGRKKKKGKDVKKAYAKKLTRVEDVEKPWEPWELHLQLEPAGRSGDLVARLEQAVIERDGFGLGPIDLDLHWRDRLAILGANGSGKTTLLQALLGELPLAAGSRRIGRGVVLGELDQARRRFASGEPLLASFVDGAEMPETEARTLLAKFGLGADDVRRPGLSLSPGERTRAAVALFAARRVNCLVLDEPTNHLDLPAIEELEEAVADYEGTVLLVTHDRRFLERFAATRKVQL